MYKYALLATIIISLLAFADNHLSVVSESNATPIETILTSSSITDEELLDIEEGQKYDRQLVIKLWDKSAGEITLMKADFERVAKKYNLKVEIQNIPETDKQWRKLKQ